jgi:hypothetical protein
MQTNNREHKPSGMNWGAFWAAYLVNLPGAIMGITLTHPVSTVLEIFLSLNMLSLLILDVMAFVGVYHNAN